MGKIRKHKKKPGTATATKSMKSLDAISLNKRKQKHFSKKTKIAKKVNKGNTTQKTVSHGVIRLTNIPHGFYEEPMQRYFSQFGKVLEIKIARSRKTAKPLGLAYVKFMYRGVARIVAQSMNGYLMFNKIMRCKYIKAAKVSEIMMFGNRFTNAKSCPGVLKHRFTVDEYNRKRTAEEESKRISRLAEKIMKKEKMLKDMGLNINLNVPEEKIYKKLGKKSPTSNTIKEEHLTPEETKKFDEAKEKVANEIKAKLEEQKENNQEEDTESESEDEDDTEAQRILEVDESEDEIVFKTPPNVVKKVRKSSVSESKGNETPTKRKSVMEDPKSLFKKGKGEIDPSAPTPKIKTPKSKISNSDTPKTSKKDKLINTPRSSAKKSVKSNEMTPVLPNKKSKLGEKKAATPGMKTPKMKRKLKVPKSA